MDEIEFRVEFGKLLEQIRLVSDVHVALALTQIANLLDGLSDRVSELQLEEDE